MSSRIHTCLSAAFRVLAVACLAVACTADPEWEGRGVYDEGQPATVELSWETETPSHMTRIQLTDEESSHLNTLWVGVYDYADGAGTGKLLYSKLFTPGLSFEQLDAEKQTVTIRTTSGKRRIVAVANARSNYGITDNEELLTDLRSEGSPTARLWPLSDILDKADTWDKYRSVSACLTDSASVGQVTSNLVMSGVYWDDSTGEKHPASWVEANDNRYVEIKRGDYKLPGTIHLRSLKSYVRFNFIADPGFVKNSDTNEPTGVRITDMTIEPISWQVFNVPMISYVQENAAGNSADISRFFIDGDGSGTYKLPDNYGTSATSYRFYSGELEYADRRPVLDGDGKQEQGLWFDFYQYENKREGLASVTKYEDREREFKTDENLNTGVYRSLCSSVDDTKNNYGTFVAVNLKVRYTYTNAQSEAVSRTAYPTYTIHLGYCEGADAAEKFRDFNCRRNSRYTYNVYITDVNNIKVEAESSSSTPGDVAAGELQPGVDGDVIDTFDHLVHLDAHYCVWNVELSDNQRKNLICQIRTYFNGKEYNFKEDPTAGAAVKQISEALKGSDNFKRQMVDWVTIIPTTGEDDIPAYQPHVKPDGTTGSWTLDQFSDPDLFKHPGKAEGEDGDVKHWYTLFFNEYVYEYDLSGEKMSNPLYHQTTQNGEGGWIYYVNQNPRILWLSVAPNNVSPDGESTYSKSLYAFTQESIQTYYSTDIGSLTKNGTAIGMESINETFGMNMRWTWNKPKGNLNENNGRWNLNQYTDDSGNQWKQLVNNTILTVPAVNTQGVDIPETRYPVRALPEHVMTRTRVDEDPDPQPDSDIYYEMMNACMNRNRDNNGDGVIDNDELRWYVPTMRKYLRIVVGRESLRTPLVDYMALGRELFYGSVWARNAKNTRFHFFSSDQQFLWAEEGLSITKSLVTGSDINNESAHDRWAPWEVRCIRNLGTYLGEIIQDDPVARVYDIDPIARTIAMTYIDGSSIRAGVRVALPPHDVNRRANMLSHKFEYASKTIQVKDLLTPYLDEAGGSQIEAWNLLLSRTNPCENYTETNGYERGWRVPNQKELAILRQMKKVHGDNDHPYLTCTREFFGTAGRFMVADCEHSFALDEVSGDYINGQVLCVRDVIDGTTRVDVTDQAPARFRASGSGTVRTGAGRSSASAGQGSASAAGRASMAASAGQSGAKASGAGKTASQASGAASAARGSQAASVATGANAGSAAAESRMAAAGRASAPDFEFETREGDIFSLSDMRGSIILLLFYDPDCEHCRDAVARLRLDPWLAQMIADGEAEVLAVDAEEDFDAWRHTAQYLPLEWTVAYDRSGILAAGTYDLGMMPTLHVIGPDGTFRLMDADAAGAVAAMRTIASGND